MGDISYSMLIGIGCCLFGLLCEFFFQINPFTAIICLFGALIVLLILGCIVYKICDSKFKMTRDQVNDIYGLPVYTEDNIAYYYDANVAQGFYKKFTFDVKNEVWGFDIVKLPQGKFKNCESNVKMMY